MDGEDTSEDIAQFVSHTKTSTTACNVRRLGRPPKSVVDRSAALLDGKRVRAKRPDDGAL